MDDVKKLLAEFADHAVDGLPAADVDADVARGRRALRRIRARRRVTGVLCIAAATTAVLAVGNQVKWWGTGQSEVAGGPDEPAAAADAGRSMATPAASPKADEGTMSTFSAAVTLVANKGAWNNISCSLAPEGWALRAPVDANHVQLAPPTTRTAELEPNSGLDVQAIDAARSLDGIRVSESAGKVFHLGTSDGRETGQVLLGERWLLVQLPAGNKDWNDDLLRRFMASCTLN
ncbi:hypothetical protein OHA70_37405 [Kribbella sp. NBC_00382]|uniref:hypothetical protein n=1 Tax=Kribbella sp. NBC_00382 TaxID=2975967 RepID=UPI002E248654